MAPRKKKAEEGEFPIPEDWALDIGELAGDPAYQRAWAHAKVHKNSDKGARIYADSHWQEYEEDDAA